MARLKLRTFSIAVLLVSATLGLSLNFSESILAGSGQTFDEKSSVNQLREGFANQSTGFEDRGLSQTQDVNIQTDFFFLREIWNVIQTVVGGLGDIIGLFQAAVGLTGLAVPDAIYNLFGIVVIGVVFAVVAAARGWDV
jgi:hypothetical protein